MNFVKSILVGSAFTLPLAASGAFANCDSCGGVIDVKTIESKDKGSAVVAGAAGGAKAGCQVEKNAKSRTLYQVMVKLETGESRSFS